MEENNNNIRLMTFNILVDRRSDAPYSWEQRRHEIIALLKYYNPDIFCIQEALEHQKAYLNECFPEYECFGIGRNDGETDGEQVPIFYRKDKFTLKEKGYFWLSENPHIAGSMGWDAKCPRTVLWKQLQHKASNNSLIIANTHYDHVGKIANINSVQVINHELSSIEPSCATVLCGDFNSPENSPPYEQILCSGFMDAATAEGTICYGLPFTYHRFMMDQYTTDLLRLQKEHDRIFRAIDHVFYSGGIKILRYGILADNQSGIYPSDHFPVLCDFKFTHSPQ
jgi:endonuclease/exonuclease/phosphatase family metal-dependent hydrolase